MKRLGFVAAAAMSVAGASAAQADCGEVSITEMDWASSAVVTAVADFLMTQGYGCTVQRVPSSTVPALTSVAETGEPDIVTEIWINSNPAFDRLVEQGRLIALTEVLSDGAVEGWWIPQYLAEAHPELTTLEGIMANPDLVGGRFHDCPSGWACDYINLSNYQATGLEDAGVERFQHGSGETLATSIASAFQDEEPWFGYYWAPTSVLGKYPMVQVETAPFDADVHNCNADVDCQQTGLSAYPASRVVTAVSNTFNEANPEISALLTNIQFTNAQMNEILAWQDDNNASYDEAAVYFLTTYNDVWGDWLSDDARANLSALLQ